MGFAERLKELRESCRPKIYQKELADAVGVSRQAITMWETGQRIPESETLQKLADYFDCSVDYLLGRSDIRETPGQCYMLAREEKNNYTTGHLPPIFDDLDPETIKILNRADKLTPRAKEQLKEAIKWVFELDAKERELQNYKSNIIELPTEKTREKGE